MPHRSTATVLRLMTSPAAPATDATPAPFTVRKYPPVRGWCWLVVHDWRGEPAFRVEYPADKIAPDVIRRLQLHARAEFGPERPDLRIG